MTIYDSYNNVLLETIVSDKSSLYCGLDNKDRLTLHFTLDRHVDIPIGSWCNFEGNRYEVMSDADVKMNHTENYDYTVVLSSYFDLTARYKVRNMVDRRLKFDLVAKPHEHLKMIVDNLNARGGGWSIGSCIDSVEKLISYNHTNCEEALVNIANTFNTEIEVVGKVVSLKKVEYFKDDPLALSYGKGNGFRPGIQRTSVEDGLPVERLFVQGGNRNISLKEYGSSELHLPKSLSFKFDGNKFDGEDGFNKDHAKSFVTDSDGMSVAVEGMAGGREDSLDLSEVYPSRVGKVTGVVFIFKGKEYTTPNASWTADDWNEVQIDIVDDTIPDSLDFNTCLMENNEPLTVVFQSGMLAGRELNANYLSDKKRFQLIKQEFDGQYMPQESFIPKKDDSYAVFNVYLPASYISDATTYSGAEYDMLREASRYLYEKCVSEFTFAGEIDGMWAKKNWEAIGPRMRIGSYVSFTHEKMFPDEPALVRIVGITQYVNNPHYPKIELSNSVGVSTVSSRLNQIENKDAHVAELYEEARRYTKRRYADIKQTIKMLSDAFDNYSEGINPITVETMLAIIGDKSLQYLFTKSIDIDDPVALEYSFDPNDGVFSVSEAFIKHMTLEIDSISPVHSNDEYLRWNVAAYASESLEKDSGYYLYAKVSKDSQQGTFLLSKESIKLEAEEGYYNLLVGILNAEVDGERSFASMYGFTEILPGQITTDTIKSADGNTWLDLLKGILYLNNMAGVSGVKTEEKGDQSIAAWFGGLMKDIELDNDKENAAKSLIRHDGTGYFADGLFKWDRTNGVNLGNDAIKINYDGSVDFGGNIRIGSTGEETLDSLLTIVATLADTWKIDKKTGVLVTDKPVRIKNNLIVDGDTASGGTSDSTTNIGTVDHIVINGKGYYPDNAGIVDLSEAFEGLQVDVDLSGYLKTTDIAAWAKASTKPTYTKAEIGLGNVDNTADSAKSVLYAVSAGSAPASDVYAWAKKSSLAASDVPDLSSKYQPLATAINTGNIGNQTVAKANQLTTARTIWGQSFNGTDKVDGVATMTGASTDLFWKAKGSQYEISFGIGAGNVNRGIYDHTNSSWLIYRASGTNIYFPSGNIGIGRHDASYKLDVAGSGRFTGDVTIEGNLIVKGDSASGGTSASNTAYLPLSGGTMVSGAGIYNPNGSASYAAVAFNTNANAFGDPYFPTILRSSLDVTLNKAGTTYTLVHTGNISSYALPKSGGALTGDLTIDGNTYIRGISTNPYIRFSYGGQNWHCQAYTTNNKIGVFLGVTSSLSLKVDASGNVTYAGTIGGASDIRYKNKKYDYTLDLLDIANAPLFAFVWNDRADSDLHIGSSAQYWESVTPQFVSGLERKFLDYATLGVAMGISLAKELLSEKERNNEQDRRLEKIESKLNERYNGAVC